MFSRWGAFVYRLDARSSWSPLLVAVAMGVFAHAARRAACSSGGWLDPASESARVDDRLAAEFGAGQEQLIVLFRGDGRRRRDLARRSRRAIATSARRRQLATRT